MAFNDNNDGHPTGAGLKGSTIDLRTLHNKADNMDGPTPSLEAVEQEGKQEGIYQPLRLDTTVDTAVSMFFIGGANPDKEIFAGRAITAAPTATDLNAGTPSDHQSSSQNAAASPDSGPARMPSPPHFRRDRAISLISRGLANMTASSESHIPTKGTPIFDSASSTDDGSSEFTTSKLHLSTHPSELSYLGTSKEWRMGQFSTNISVVPLDAENTVLAIDGTHYKIPNSELWLYSYQKDQVMPAHRFVHLIRHSFYLNVDSLGAQKAVEAINGHRLLDFRAAPIPRASTKATGSDATAAETEDRNTIIYPSMSSLRSHFAVYMVSSEGDSDGSNAASDVLNRNSFAPGSIEMDGPSSLEKVSGPLLSPIQLTNSPATITRTGSEDGSVRSVKTVRSSKSDVGEEWNTEELFRFTNTVRAALRTQSISHDDLDMLKGIVDVFLVNEHSEQAAEFSLIVQTRFDKLIKELINMKRIDTKCDGLVAQARSLQGLWKQRFQGDYLLIDKDRFETMTTRGALQGLTLEVDSETKAPLWQVQRGSPIADADLNPGHFWLNIECAYRDGVVEGTRECVTVGKYGILTLPLLTGTEVDGPEPGVTRYNRKGSTQEMHLKLMATEGHPVRILRGYGLKSKYGPNVGIRYDGEYTIHQYGHLPLDPDTKISELRMLLKRVGGQIPVNALRNIPNPAQLDDWYMYKRYVQQKTRIRKAQVVEQETGDADRNADVANTEWNFDEVFGCSNKEEVGK